MAIIVGSGDYHYEQIDDWAKVPPGWSLHEVGAVGVDKQDNAIDHAQRALDFAAKIAVAGRVDDINFSVVEKQRGVFREDGDAALALKVVGVHDALDDGFVGAEDAGLLEHGVDEGGLAVVDVGNDGDVAKLHEQLRFLLAGDVRARSAPAVLLNAEMTGMRRRAVCEPR